MPAAVPSSRCKQTFQGDALGPTLDLCWECIYIVHAVVYWVARIIWDERNRRHLLEDNAARRISPTEVEEVLQSPSSLRQRGRGGELRVVGKTPSGRRLTVIAERPAAGVLRPITAWET